MKDINDFVYYFAIILLLFTLFIFMCTCQLPVSHFELKFSNKYYIVNYANKKALMPYENNTIVSLLDYSSENKRQKWKFIPINDKDNIPTKYFYIFNSGLNMYLTLDENKNIILNTTYNIADNKAEVIWNINEVNITGKADIASVLNCNIRTIENNEIKEYGILELNKDNLVILNINKQNINNTHLWQIYTE
jgi:hypothetical protein